MEPLIDVANMVANTPGGALGIFVVAPAVFGLVIGIASKNPGAALAAISGAMAVCIVGLGLSPWLFVMVAFTAIASVMILMTLGWSGR